MYLCEVVTQSSVLINQGVLISEVPLREVPLYVKPLLVATILYPLPVGPMGWGETTGVSVNGGVSHDCTTIPFWLHHLLPLPSTEFTANSVRWERQALIT